MKDSHKLEFLFPKERDMLNTKVALPEELAAATGCAEAIVAVAEDFTDRGTYNCDNPYAPCRLPARPFNKRLIAVVTDKGEQIPYCELEEPVRTALDWIRGKFSMCFPHLVQAHRDRKIPVGKP